MRHGPPWILVVRLPDDTPPIDLKWPAFPEGSTTTAYCGDLAEAVLASVATTVAAIEGFPS